MGNFVYMTSKNFEILISKIAFVKKCFLSISHRHDGFYLIFKILMPAKKLWIARFLIVLLKKNMFSSLYWTFELLSKTKVLILIKQEIVTKYRNS